jgi:hypothetical protein
MPEPASVTCTEAQALFLEELEGDDTAAPDAVEAMTAHVQGCAACSAAVGRHVRVHRALLEASLAPEAAARGPSRTRRPLVVGALGLAAAAALLLARRPSEEPPSTIGANAPAVPGAGGAVPALAAAPTSAAATGPGEESAFNATDAEIVARVFDVVRDFGATGDGVTDDTAAVQDALTAAERHLAAGSGGAAGAANPVAKAPEVHFPAGTYLVTSLRAAPGLALVGDAGAVVKRAPRQSRWSHLLTVSHSGPADSAPFVMRGLTLDGNVSGQSATQPSELDQQHMAFFVARTSGGATTGRLRVTIEQVNVRNGASGGLTFFTNVEATVRALVATDVPGGVVVNGGNTSLDLSDATLRRGPLDEPTELFADVVGRGHGGSTLLTLRLRNVTIEGGGVDLDLRSGSRLTAEGLIAEAPSLLIGPGAVLRFASSRLGVGRVGGRTNQILCPSDLTLEDSELVVERGARDPAGSTYAALNIGWRHSTCGPVQGRQRISLTNVRVSARGDFDAADTISLLRTSLGDPGSEGEVEIDGGSIAPTLTSPSPLRRGSTVILRGVAAETPLSFQPTSGSVRRLTPVAGRLDARVTE